MVDIRKLYFELIQDFDPYEDLSKHENYTESEMLYNMIEIRENDLESIDDYILVDRFNTLIDLFKALGINPYYDYVD